MMLCSLAVLLLCGAASASETDSCSWNRLPSGTGIRGQATKSLRSVTTAAGCCAACTAAGEAQCSGWVLQKTSKTGRAVCHLKNSGGPSYDCGPLCEAAALAPPPPAPTCPRTTSTKADPRLGDKAGDSSTTTTTMTTTSAPPHIFVILQDDLGHDDVSFHGNTANDDVTGNITAAAKEVRSLSACQAGQRECFGARTHTC